MTQIYCREEYKKTDDSTFYNYAIIIVKFFFLFVLVGEYFQ